MKARKYIKEGLLEDILQDNSINLNRNQIELIDIIYCGEKDDIENYCLESNIEFNSENIISEFVKLIDVFISEMADNCPKVHLYCEEGDFDEDKANDYFFNEI